MPSWLEDLASGSSAAGTGGWNSRGGRGFGGSDMRDNGWDKYVIFCFLGLLSVFETVYCTVYSLFY